MMGVSPEIVRKVAIAMYEGEINMVIHASGGTIDVIISPEEIEMILKDQGPGIEDIEMAMKAGYSTAPDKVRALLGNLLRTESSAVNGLLAAKAVQAEKRSIRMAFDISTALKKLPLEDWEFCRVLSNLLDNAMDAAEIAADPVVELKLWEDIKGLRFSVTNHGPAIPQEIMQRIFQSGFSTKGDKGTGMGQYIVDTIMKEHGGEITVQSTDQATCFAWLLPPIAQAAASSDN
jgi:anti-sigma regulatory factor (Ser/Thr protein kinase)